MTITINHETFKPLGLNLAGDTVGTVEVSFGRQVIECKCIVYNNAYLAGELSLCGFVGRYRTSNKPWLAYVYETTKANGDKIVQASFGRDDRAGRFHKMDGISYEPETYFRECNPAVWEIVN